MFLTALWLPGKGSPLCSLVSDVSLYFCHFRIWCSLSGVILECINSWSLLFALQLLIMPLGKKLLLNLHVITEETEFNIFIYMLL